MDTKLNYEALIKKILAEHAKLISSFGKIKPHLLFNAEKKDYALIDIGWNKKCYIYGSVIHLQIINNKIWIQYDGTEYSVAMELVDAGVPREDIILGFRHPDIRQYTEFGVA